jgi:hypothetical protein
MGNCNNRQEETNDINIITIYCKYIYKLPGFKLRNRWGLDMCLATGLSVHNGSSMCVCVYIYIYTHTHTHIHIYIYTHTQTTHINVVQSSWFTVNSGQCSTLMVLRNCGKY